MARLSSISSRYNNIKIADRIPERIGSKLQAARKILGLTQQEVADQLGISRTYYLLSD